MAEVIIVSGPTGSGKTTSLRNLNPDETFIVRCTNKSLPFAKAKSLYNAEKRNLATFKSANESNPVAGYIQFADIVSILPSLSNVKTVVFDDFGMLMSDEFLSRSKEAGYTKFTDLSKHVNDAINMLKNLDLDIVIVLMYHDEIDGDEFNKVRKLSLMGRMTEDKCHPSRSVTYHLYTHTTFDKKDGKANYWFVTNTTKLDNIKIEAKSPIGVFEDILIPNDLDFVIKRIHEFES